MMFEISHLTVIHIVANMIENHIYIDIVYRITFLDFIVPKKVYHNSVKFERRPLILLRSEDGILPPLREHVPPFNCSGEGPPHGKSYKPYITWLFMGIPYPQESVGRTQKLHTMGKYVPYVRAGVPPRTVRDRPLKFPRRSVLGNVHTLQKQPNQGTTGNLLAPPPNGPPNI